MIYRAHVTHHIPGRVRVKMPHAKGNPEMLNRVKAAISPQPGVRSVEVNPATGSVLVRYDPELHENYQASLAEHAERTQLFEIKPPELTEADEIASKIEAEAEFLAEHSETARSVVTFVKHLNEGIKQATDNTVDLKVLLPLGLAVYTFFEVGSDAVTPLWITLGIFSFNSFIALHHSAPSVTVDDHQVIVDKEPPAKKSSNVSARARKRR